MKFPSFGHLQESHYVALDNDDEHAAITGEKQPPKPTPWYYSTASKLLATTVLALSTGIIVGILACNYHHAALAQKNWLGKKTQAHPNRQYEQHLSPGKLLTPFSLAQLQQVPWTTPSPTGGNSPTRQPRRRRGRGKSCSLVRAASPSIHHHPTYLTKRSGGRGFIQNPAIGPNKMGVAVYHQLHCLVCTPPSLSLSLPFSRTPQLPLPTILHLPTNRHNHRHPQDALRRGYYTARNETTTPSGKHHTDPAHIRHCIDYLRQSLLCAADTNMEPVDDELGGITGWGPRKCRDIKFLLASSLSFFPLPPPGFDKQLRIEKIHRPLSRPGRQSVPLYALVQRPVLGRRLQRVPEPFEGRDGDIAFAYDGLA
ncbi:MAG: hypothetical protein Q9184_002333 [Pyrenodesmia sp. 2 TL-2023]